MVIYMFEWQRLFIVQAVYTGHLLTKSMLKFLHANSECSPPRDSPAQGIHTFATRMGS